jgi:aspartate/methionine/tyrosine aminotransferase
MRYKDITSFRVMDLVAKAKEYKDVIHFEIGEPSIEPSSKVLSAIKEAIDAKAFGYTPTLGLLELREKIASHYKKEYNLSVDTNQILVTPGTSNAFLIAYLLTLNSGDTLAISDPSYPCYKNFATMVDAKLEALAIDKSTNYMLTPSHLIGKKIDTLHISSPSNPTGNIYDDKSLKELIDYCKKSGIYFISDELYHGLVYDTQPKSALNFSQDVIVINGFSKYFCMPGFRVGWMILPKELIKPAENIAQNLYLSAPTLSQYGALEAFDYSYLKSVKEEYKKRRDYLYSELSQIFEIEAKPDGAFYLWCDISKYRSDAVEFSYELLDNIQIAVTPGVDFGTNCTKSKLRFSYTRDIEHMQEGIKRLKKYLKVE